MVRKFRAPAASWEQGGVEIFVKSLKQEVLVEKKMKGRRYMTHLKFETMQNILASRVNERPLSLYAKIGELLYPNQLLYGNSGARLGTVDLPEVPMLERACLAQEYTKAYLDKWDLIRRTGELRTLEKWREVHGNVRVGEIVQILDKPTEGN